MVQSLSNTIWQFPNILNIHLSCDKSIALLDIKTREMKAQAHMKTCTFMVIVAYFVIARNPCLNKRVKKLSKNSRKMVEQKAPGICLPTQTAILLTKCIKYNYFGIWGLFKGLQLLEESLGSKLQLILDNFSLQHCGNSHLPPPCPVVSSSMCVPETDRGSLSGTLLSKY